MTPRTSRRRTAFTLVELLVVMGIIAMMISLLMAAVSRARESGKRTLAHTEIRELGQGIALFKQKYTVDYIPSKITLRDDGAYVITGPSATQLEIDSLTWLKAAWPHLTFPVDWNQNGNLTDVVTLEGDQCLVFFLGGINDGGQPGGFSTNPRNPMDTSNPNGKRVGPFAQFQVARLVARQTNAAGVAGFRSYIDPWKTQPYAYFTSYGKQRGYRPYSDLSGPLSDCDTLQTLPTKVNHYVDPSTSKALNADGFQIITAGTDKTFGAGGTNLPATGPGEDDIANFSRANLGSGIQ
jgi:type II secretory pathway pseudopilin PulG